MDKRELEITAELANIELSDTDVGTLSSAVEQMIEYFELMADASDLPAVDQHGKNFLRPDIAKDSTIQKDILNQAPELEDSFIIIPNVL